MSVYLELVHGTKDPNPHVHVEHFDVEDAAFAYIHGVHLGAHQPYIADEHSLGGYTEECLAEALVYGLGMGIQHRGRIQAAELEITETGGFKVSVFVGGTK